MYYYGGLEDKYWSSDTFTYFLMQPIFKNIILASIPQSKPILAIKSPTVFKSSVSLKYPKSL